MYKIVNNLFIQSRFGKHDEENDAEMVLRRKYSTRTVQSKYPIFLLNIECSNDLYEVFYETEKKIIQFKVIFILLTNNFIKKK